MSAPLLNVELKIDQAEVTRLTSVLADIPNAGRRAMQRAGSKTVTRSVGAISRTLARDSGLPAKITRWRVRHKKPTFRNLNASVWIGARKVMLDQAFPVTPLKKGYRFGSGRNAFTFRDAFSAKMRNGKSFVVRRREGGAGRTKGRPETSSPNLPIDRPSIPLRINATAEGGKMRGMYMALLSQEVNYEITKIARRS